MTTIRNFLQPTNKMAFMAGVTTVLAGGVLVGTQPASAVNIGNPPNGETSLQEHFDNITTSGSIDAQADQSGYELFTNTSGSIGSATITLEEADFAPNNNFGIYKAGDKSTTLQLFDGNKGPGDDVAFSFNANNSVELINSGAVVNNFGNEFGFYLENENDNTFYSQAGLNPGGKQQSVIYQGEGEDLDLPGNPGGSFGATDFLIGFEDLARNSSKSDSDFNDMVVHVSDVEPTSVPEPSAMAALGLIGGAMTFVRRRRQ